MLTNVQKHMRNDVTSGVTSPAYQCQLSVFFTCEVHERGFFFVTFLFAITQKYNHNYITNTFLAK